MHSRKATAAWIRLFLTPIVIVASLGACFQTALDPQLPDGAHQFTPPAIYQVWWSMTAECSGRDGDLAGVEWFVVPGVSSFDHEGGQVAGYWSRVSNRVVVAEKAMMDGQLVRHEMLHSLERNIDHPRSAFLGKCGGVVVCTAHCLTEAGSAPIPRVGLARVPADSLSIDVHVNPIEPGQAIDNGHFRVTVTVRNPRRDSIVVALPSAGDAAPPGAFSFTIRSERIGLWYAERAWDTGVMTFGPGETRRAVYDFTVAQKFDGLRALPPGSYDVRGGFGPASSAPRSFVLAQ